MRNLELWIERYAELLGVDPDPAKVAAAIALLQDERDRAKASIPRHRKAAAEAVVAKLKAWANEQ